MNKVRWVDMWIKVLLDAAYRNPKNQIHQQRGTDGLSAFAATPKPAGSKLARSLRRRGSLYAR